MYCTEMTNAADTPTRFSPVETNKGATQAGPFVLSTTPVYLRHTARVEPSGTNVTVCLCTHYGQDLDQLEWTQFARCAHNKKEAKKSVF